MEYGVHPSACITVEVRGDLKSCCIGPNVIIGYEYSHHRSKFYDNSPSPPKPYVIIGSDVFIGPNTVIASGASIGESTIVEHNCYLGEDTSIGTNCFIRYQAQIFRRVTIGHSCVISGFLCNNTIVENDVTFHGIAIHRYLDRVSGIPEPSPKICSGAFVGFNATLVGPIVVGERAVIKTGATVLSSVPAGKIVGAGEVYREKQKH